MKKMLEEIKNSDDLFFKIIITHAGVTFLLLILMVILSFIDSYFALLIQTIALISSVICLSGISLNVINEDIIDNDLACIKIYITILVIVFVIFFIKYDLIRDMSAYLNDDYEIISGQITDVGYKTAKYKEHQVKTISVDGEIYRLQMVKMNESDFAKDYGLNTKVEITYLRNSKQIISIH